MRWEVLGRRDVYRSPWVDVWLADVELPDGRRIEHHELRFPRQSVSAVVVREDEVLLLWRHRYITDAWGWEVPAGWAENGEEPAAAIRREIEEETGWRAATVTAMTRYNAISGIGDMRFISFLATGAEYVGEPVDTAEASRVEWHPLADVPKLAAAGQLVDGPSLTALAYYLGVHAPGVAAP